MTKQLTIAKRLKNGWTSYQPNDQKYVCDDCGERLYIAPDGKTPYCDNISTKHKEKKNG